MTTVYLLPCTCGEKLRIDARQAGLDVRCQCGRDVKAPTFRELSALEHFDEASTVKPAAEWGARQRLWLGGGVIALCGLALATVFWWATPPEPTFEINRARAEEAFNAIRGMPAEQLIGEWATMATQDLDRTEHPQMELWRREVRRMHGFMYMGLTIAAAGALVLASSLFVGRRPKRRA